MARTLVVTCGTSLLDEECLTRILSLNLAGIGYKQLESDYFASEDEDFDENWLNRSDISRVICEIARPIDALPDKVQFVGRDRNPLGAELSTLLEYFDEHGGIGEGNDFYLLCSQTYKGLFAGGLLKKLIEPSLGQAHLHLVAGLREQPRDAERAMQNLASALMDIMKKTSAVAQRPNKPLVFIMSGGFKSVVPCLTIFSLLFGIPLVYLFETSNRLQQPVPILDPRDFNQWRDIWSKMYETRIAESIPWFREALDFRNQHPNEIWW